MGRTDIHAVSAVDAAIFDDHCRTILYLDGLHRTTTYTLVAVTTLGELGIDGVDHALAPISLSAELTRSRTHAVSSP
ncbi:hypothetical protein SDC9_54369 [bioreactor metagenome]|uniref:Uncharacterized protein n=1 Tax=bioreactor metagenome TaxID=1076179 RepID=A0A644WWI6_9ZZZZ